MIALLEPENFRSTLRIDSWGRKLTEQDKKTLCGMMDDPFFHEQRELFARMLKVGMKVEQECIE